LCWFLFRLIAASLRYVIIYTQHGGNLDAVEREYGIPKDKIIDFSGNVNPLGPPAAALRAIADGVGAIERYPDIEYRVLREGIGRYAGVDTEFVIPGNGSTELISGFIRGVSPKSAVVVSPAYSEYERAIAFYGGDIKFFEIKPEDGFEVDVEKLIYFARGAELLVICNPNNPTGAAVTIAQLEYILLELPNTKVMVDETYAEFADAPVLSARHAERHFNLFIVRGTSKFFAVPGLRLGYALCGDEKTRQRMLENKDPWSVNILSAVAGEAIFSDSDEMREYIRHTKKLTAEWRALWERTKIRRHLHIYESHANFMLAKILNPELTAAQITDKLLKSANILIRNAASFPYLDERYIRFCMRLPSDSERLVHALEGVL
jgi:threonine-phosphate decarboxylase